MPVELFKAELDQLILISSLVDHPSRQLTRKEKLLTRILWQADSRAQQQRLIRELNFINPALALWVKQHGVSIYVSCGYNNQARCEKIYSVDISQWDQRFTSNPSWQQMKSAGCRDKEIEQVLKQFAVKMQELLAAEIKMHYPYVWGYINVSEYFCQ
jgi:hypothetical protein